MQRHRSFAAAEAADARDACRNGGWYGALFDTGNEGTTLSAYFRLTRGRNPPLVQRHGQHCSDAPGRKVGQEEAAIAAELVEGGGHSGRGSPLLGIFPGSSARQ